MDRFNFRSGQNNSIGSSGRLLRTGTGSSGYTRGREINQLSDYKLLKKVSVPRS